MAENENAEQAENTSQAKGGILPWIIVGVIASAIGAVVPIGLTMFAAPPANPKTPQPYETTPASTTMVFHSYGDVTVNLDEGRMNRYLRLRIVLHIRQSDEPLVKKALQEQDLILRNWLISHLSDKEINDIRGKAGQNMLRREIRDHFNSTLFRDSYERIYDVLFEEFNVQ